MSSIAQLADNDVKHLYLKVRSDKYNFFVELVRNLGFVKIESGRQSAANHKKTEVIANIRQGFIDRRAIDEGTLKTYPIEGLFDE